MEPSLAPEVFWYATPPRIGSAGQFTDARRVFESAGYNYVNLCERLKVEHIYRYRMTAPETLLEQAPAGALDLLIRVFAQGLYIEDAALKQWLSAEGLGAM